MSNLKPNELKKGKFYLFKTYPQYFPHNNKLVYANCIKKNDDDTTYFEYINPDAHFISIRSWKLFYNSEYDFYDELPNKNSYTIEPFIPSTERQKLLMKRFLVKVIK